MHGRPRPPKDYVEDPAKVKATEQKAALYAKLSKEVLDRRAKKLYDTDSLALCASLLELNPEVYTAWNYRREAYKELLEGKEGLEKAKNTANAELALTFKALLRNPKSYVTWHHRKWVISMRLAPDNLEDELGLIAKLLKQDERNFHGWNYRRWLSRLMNRSPEDELEFTLEKINENFSNYSAWHSRTKLLLQVHAQRPTRTLADLLAEERNGPSSAASQPPTGEGRQPAGLVPGWALEEEYELVRQAFYTEPEDQSGWMYHRWLLGNSLAHWDAARGTPGEQAAREALASVLSREAQVCVELLEIEPDEAKHKWPLLTLARLREEQARLLVGDVEKTKEEVKEMYEKLIRIDPLRKGYYQDVIDGKADNVTRALGTGGAAKRVESTP